MALGVTQPMSLLTLSDLRMLGIDMVSSTPCASQIPMLMPRFRSPHSSTHIQALASLFYCCPVAWMGQMPLNNSTNTLTGCPPHWKGTLETWCLPLCVIHVMFMSDGHRGLCVATAPTVSEMKGVVFAASEHRPTLSCHPSCQYRPGSALSPGACCTQQSLWGLSVPASDNGGTENG